MRFGRTFYFLLMRERDAWTGGEAAFSLRVKGFNLILDSYIHRWTIEVVTCFGRTFSFLLTRERDAWIGGEAAFSLRVEGLKLHIAPSIRATRAL